jgi:hypothetical protein
MTMPGGRPRKNGVAITRQPDTTAANVGYEAQLWQMADALRGSMDAALLGSSSTRRRYRPACGFSFADLPVD